jgi:hypothetical protein
MTTTTTDWRALCAELVTALRERIDDKSTPSPQYVNAIHLIDRTATALAQPEPQGPTDEELLNLGNDLMGDCLPCDPDLLLAFARAVFTRWGRPAIEPVPVSERLPGAEDCIRRGDDDWCWGQERSLLTGQAAARWRLMRVSSLADEAVAWAPHWAFPVPTAQ